MRVIATWKRSLAKRLAEETGASVAEMNRLCDVELGLSMLRAVAPSEPPFAVSAILSGFVPDWFRAGRWNDGERQIVAVARQLLQYHQGRRRWTEALEEYSRFPIRFRLFNVQGAKDPFTVLSTSVCPERATVYSEALMSSLAHVVRRISIAETGKTYYYKKAGRWVSVVFPEWAGRDEKPKESRKRDVRMRKSLYVPWQEIEAEAHSMDERAPGRDWLSTIERIQLEFPIGNKDPLGLEICDTTHVVGIVGAGKSTLMDVLTVWAVHHGLRVTVLVGDVPDAMRRASMFKGLGLKAVPILGASERGRHMARARRIFYEQDRKGGELPDEDPRSEWISPVCLLDGLSQNWPPLSVGDEPCDRLFATTEAGEPHALCPFIRRCPVHKAENEMSEADVWVATPASLIYTKVPPHTNPEILRTLENVYRHSDLVIVDEADRVQVQFDNIFGPSDVLIGSTGEGWLDKLQRLTATRPGGRGFLTRETNRWSQAQRMSQQAADLIYALVNDIAPLKRWVSQRDYFTAWTLFLQLRSDLSGEDEETELAREVAGEIAIFLRDPLGEEEASVLSSLARGVTSAAHSSEVSQQSRQCITKWLGRREGEISIAEMQLFENKLVLATATAVLEERLKTLVDHWEIGEAAFGLESESEWFFRRPPRDYQALMPEAPMGNLFGFRFVAASGGEKSVALQFFRLAGVGRWLLTHLHNLFQPLDAEDGPSVLLLSATSWAPASKSFHVHLQPAGILHTREEDIRTISESKFSFTPTIDSGEPVFVSGRHGEERMQSLDRILTELAIPARSGDPSKLERDLESLPDGRQRALIVVGSYPEAEHGAAFLHRQWQWKDDVVALVPDDESDRDRTKSGPFLRRGVVHQFARRPERLLIAPLLAIERGHNILTSEGEAAIGSIYFLVRPMPVPFSLATAIQGINHWAMNHPNAYADDSISESWQFFRNAAMKRWHAILSNPGRYRELTQAERDALCWMQLVFLWQTVGRAVRRGASVRVFFCDAAFAPETAKGKVDGPQTSLLLGMRDVLARFQSEREQHDWQEIALLKTLYGPLASAMSNIAGLDQ